jgi:hypothetical protein
MTLRKKSKERTARRRDPMGVGLPAGVPRAPWNEDSDVFVHWAPTCRGTAGRHSRRCEARSGGSLSEVCPYL